MWTLALVSAVAAVASAAEFEGFEGRHKDRMADLPDAPAFTTPTYSGYLKASSTKQLHYVLATSMDKPETDPLVIWFNGGPGCSSMLGMMQELGPIVVDDGEDYFATNPHPWNERANVLFIESPAGVGWSHAGTKADLSTNDMVQSQDALESALLLLQRMLLLKLFVLFLL